MSNLAVLIPASIVAPRPDQNPARVYLAGLARGSRPTQLCSLERIARFLGSSSIDVCPWHELRFAHTQVIRTWVLERYAPSTANRFLAAVRGVLRAAYELELLAEGDYQRAARLAPVRGVRLPAGRAITPGELRSLFLACTVAKGALGARDAALLALCYGAGLRRAETVALDVDAIDGNALRVMGKGNKERRIYLAAGGVRAVEAWFAVRGREPGPLLLACRKGGDIEEPRRRLCEDSVAAIVERIAARAGVGRFSPHDLRRTFVGDLLDAGADLSTVQQLAGHAQASTTARYDRRGERAKSRAADLLSIPFGG